jgi:peptide/bleomycin uptake transporter
MFASFFPSPKRFFLSAVAWFFVSLALWYGLFDSMAAQFSLMREALPTEEGQRPPFLNPDKVWLYQYIVLVTALFCVAWFLYLNPEYYCAGALSLFHVALCI